MKGRGKCGSVSVVNFGEIGHLYYGFGVVLDVLQINAGQKTPTFYHKRFDAGLVYFSGSGFIEIDCKKYGLPPQGLFKVKSYEEYKLVADEREGFMVVRIIRSFDDIYCLKEC